VAAVQELFWCALVRLYALTIVLVVMATTATWIMIIDGDGGSGRLLMVVTGWSIVEAMTQQQLWRQWSQ